VEWVDYAIFIDDLKYAYKILVGKPEKK